MKSLTRQRKAQLTIFIILGVIILIGAGVLLFLRRPVEEAAIEEVAEEVPLEVKPIQEFVSSCLYDKTKEALIKVGQHGGYIDMADPELSSRTFKLDPADPTESDAAFLTPLEGSAVAYWWYLAGDNGCTNCIVSDQNRPNFDLIENQIEIYVTSHLDECIDGFSGFKKAGFDIAVLDAPSPVITIAEEDVVASLRYPLNVMHEDRTTEMSKFFARLDLNFKDIYDFATEIVRADVETAFLDDIITHLIALNSAVDFGRLPPFFGQEESFVPVVWSKSLAQLQLQSLMTSHAPLIQIAGTKGAEQPLFSDDEMLQNVYAPFFVDALEDDYPQYSVRFFYFNWPYYFDIRPSEGDMIKPSSITHIKRGLGPFKIPFVFKPLHYYEYYYDVSFPLIAEIKSYDEFFNETYILFVAVEANIRDNRNLREWYEGRGTFGPKTGPYMKLQASGAVGESIATDGGLTEKEVAELPIVSGNFTKSLFCNPRQRIGSNITVIVKDKRNGSAVDGAEISYACGPYDTCKMGLTQVNEATDESSFTSQFPVCIGGGVLTVDKPGYVESAVVELTTLPDDKQVIEVDLEPVRTKYISFGKYILDRIVINNSLLEEEKWLEWNGTLHNLTSVDMILLNVQRIKQNAWDIPFGSFVVFYGNDSLNNELFRKIDLIPGNYTISLQYFYSDQTVIPKECQHMCDICKSDFCEKWCREYPDKYTSYCDPGSSVAISAVLTPGISPTCNTCDCKMDVWIPEEKVAIDTSILGGFEMNETEPWTVTTYDLDYAGDMIEFYLVQTPLPRCVQDLSELEEVMGFYTSERGSMIPRFYSSEEI